MPLISIYIPTHNRSVLLQRAINSVLKQSYKNIEIIVVDDGSSDDTQQVLTSYKKKHNNIIVLKNELPKGACLSRNRAINIAKGEYITGLDDDDEFEFNHLENLMKNYDHKYSLVTSSLKENTGNGVFSRSEGSGIVSLNTLLHYNAIGNQVFTKTEYLKAIDGFDEQLPALQDYDTWVRLIKHYGDGLKLEQATYIWHTGHEQQRISNSNTKRILAFDIFMDKHKVLMSKSHFESMFILEKKIYNQSFTLIELLKNINIYNFKSALSLYLNLNFSYVGKIWRSFKGKVNI